jgi:hypothetical protein
MWLVRNYDLGDRAVGANFNLLLITYSLTPRSRVLREKTTVSQLVKEFPKFYGTQRFITAFIIARYLSLS